VKEFEFARYILELVGFRVSIQLHNQTNNQVPETPMSRDGVNVYVGE
jgi:hypothetical protein